MHKHIHKNLSSHISRIVITTNILIYTYLLIKIEVYIALFSIVRKLNSSEVMSASGQEITREQFLL